MPELTQTLRAVVPSTDRRDYQFAAILGDLQHKTDCYLVYGGYGPPIEPYFTNESQAAYLRSTRPDLVPPPASPGQNPSFKSLGTVFERTYFTSPGFRTDYIRWLSSILHDGYPARPQDPFGPGDGAPGGEGH